MKFTKKISAVILTLVLLLGIFTLPVSSSAIANENDTVEEQDQNIALEPIESNEIKYAVNRNLSDKQISKRFEQINSSYETNEPFSLEDAEFIRAYATNSNNFNTNNSVTSPIQTYAIKLGSGSKSFNKTTTKYSVKVNFAGTVYGDINYVNHTYRGKMKTTIKSGSSKVKKIENFVTNVAYGALGNSGTYVGIVYDGSKSNDTTTAKTWSMDETVKYSAIAVVYTYTNAYTRITTSSGTFNIYAF